MKQILKSPNALCFYNGCLLSFAFAPFNFLLAIPLSFFLFLILLEKNNKVMMGWWYGFGYFLTSLYWIGNALFARADDFWWLLPIAYIGIPAFAGLYILPVALAVQATKNRYLKVLVFTISWFISEYFRANYFLPFPWNMLGYAIAGNDYLLQSAYYLGLYGSTILLLFFGSVVYLRSPIFIIICILIPTSMFIFGYVRLVKTQNEYHDFSVRIVQPNPYNHHFGDPIKSKQLLNDLLILSKTNLPKDNKIILWSEAAFPYLVSNKLGKIGILKELTDSDGFLIFGIDRINISSCSGDKNCQIPNQYYNSMLAADSQGNIIAEYDKEILVPFGEHIPFKEWLPFLKIVAHGVGEFTYGQNTHKTIALPGLLKFKPLICYEAIFPDILKAGEQPELLVALTNDAWYGNTSGPRQHLYMAKFVAARYGIPMLRSTTNGISAIIDAYGRIIKKLDYKTQGTIDYKLPKALGTVNKGV